MRTEIRFVARDGAEFRTEGAAVEHEALIAACDYALLPLGVREIEGLRGGAGYVQHEMADFVEAKRRLLGLLAAAFPTYGYESLDPATVSPMGSVGRVASEAAAPLAKAWGRLGCIDAQGREWEQPYFALHPGTGKPVEVTRFATLLGKHGR